MHDMIEYNNCCVACGEIIPEGRQVCSQCEKKYDKEDEKCE
jgi:predicted nucleic acid-binding Zn ribbon protein